MFVCCWLSGFERTINVGGGKIERERESVGLGKIENKLYMATSTETKQLGNHFATIS